MGDFRIRFGEAADSARIASLFSGSFSPDFAQLTIYGCKGAPEYIRMQVAPGLPNAESAYFVAQGPDGIIGACELRRSPNVLILNYIAIDPSHRGQRVATALLSEALRMTGVSSGGMELDVLCDNAPALRWYGKLGFTTVSSAEFTELAAPGTADEGPAYVAGLPQADLCQERFGFSSFNLIGQQGTFSAGRIGDAWFRLTSPEAVRSAAIFAALDAIDPRRRIFAIVPADSAPPAQVIRRLAKTHRMRMQIPQLMSALSRD